MNIFKILIIAVIITLSPSFTTTTSFTLNNSQNEIVDRPWWQTAIIDAGGALGGAASGATLGTPACLPCIGGGALLGGVAASLGANLTDGGGSNPNTSLAAFPNNEYDYIGINHNNLIGGFMATKLPINPENVYNYFIANSNFPIKNIVLSKKDVANIMSTYRDLNNSKDIISHIKDLLPIYINKNSFENKLQKLTTIHDVSAFVIEVKNFEKSFFKQNTISNTTDKIALKSFFSVLRHSALLWK